MKHIITLLLLTGISFYLLANKYESNIQSNLEQARLSLNHFAVDTAFLYFDSALREARRINDEDMEAHITRLMGRAYIMASNDDSALLQLGRAIEMAKSIQNDSILAMAYLNVAFVLKDRGMADSALQLHKAALRLYESTHDSIGMAKVHTSLAIHYKYSGDFDLGLESALMAHYIFNKLNLEAPLAKSYINLGNIYVKLGDYDTAAACFEHAFHLGQNINNSSIASNSLINRAVVLWHRGNSEMERGDSIKGLETYLLTKDEFLKAIDYCENIVDKRKLTLLYSNLSIVYRNIGMYTESINAAKKAIRIAKEIHVLTDQLNSLNNLGITYEVIGQYNKAEEAYLESLELAVKSNQKESINKAYSNLSNLYETMGDFKRSLDYLKLTDIYRDSIFSENKQRLIQEHKTNFEILNLRDQNQIKELDKIRIQAERNVTMGLSAFVVVLLVGLLIFFRMRARKNRVIALQRIQKLEDEKKLMAAQSVLVGQEKERERIARELHDGIGILLSTASIHFSSIENKTDTEIAKMLKKANQLLKEASKEVRQISHNMMPVVLTKFGLREAIEDLFEGVEQSGDIEVDLRITCGDERLPENMEIMIYRIVQEMLNNTLKHAGASKISLFISKDENEIYVDYIDDGIGFDPDKQMPDTGNLGLSGVRTRVEYLGGTLKLFSSHGKGTRFEIAIPINQNA